MKPDKFYFKIIGKHESHDGTATIIDDYPLIRLAAEKSFEEMGDDRPVTIRSIGLCKGPDQPGYAGTYEIYESYTDPGSINYCYYAIMIKSTPII